ncbi:MAG: hypothetical protein N2316_12690 [Spirochaetes bacterium]|nr:hypothetical protein [Spirochaetota bacterium]
MVKMVVIGAIAIGSMLAVQKEGVMREMECEVLQDHARYFTPTRFENDCDILFVAQSGDEDDEEGAHKNDGQSQGATGASNVQPSPFSIEGMVLYSYFANMYREQKFIESQKKSEFRIKTKLKYGDDNIYFLGVPNVYLMTTFIDERIGIDNPYSRQPHCERNLRCSTKASEVTFNEFYVNVGTEKARLRIGNQIFAWGTADVVNPTSYFNPFDARDFLFKEEDEIYIGIPSASLMLFFGTSVLELVYAPIHVPMAFPENGSFWFPRISSEVPITIAVEERKGMEINGENMAYGARLSGKIWDIDTSISAYHGPDKEPVFVPMKVIFPPNELLSVSVEPHYYRINKFGADASLDINKFVFQCEVAYSPNKRGLEKLPSNIQNINLPVQVEKSHYFAYSVGCNYFIPMHKLIKGHEGDSIFTVEWNQALFFKSEIEEPLITKMLISRIEDTYIDGKLKLKLTFIYEAREKGYIFWPKAEWDFQNGFSVEIAYANIEATENSFLYYYRNNDVLFFKVRYVF